LYAMGERIRGYELTGYLFFGSASALVEALKSALTSERRPDFILLDFSHISGFDISAVNNFQRFALNAKAADATIVVTAAPDRFCEALKRSLSDKAIQNITFFRDLDHGLEWCEEEIVKRSLSNRKEEASMRDAFFLQSVDDVMAYLDRQERFERLVDRLSPWLEHRECCKENAILEKGHPAGGLYLLTSGTATEINPVTGVRIRSLVPGDVIAAAAAFGCYTAPATIRPDCDCSMAFLSMDARRLLEQEDPPLSIALHGFIIESGGRGCS
jgi:SulP family sulfate permease